MIVIKMMGGYGNQLFQYMFSEYVRYLGFDVYLDVSHYNRIRDHGGYKLFEVLNIRNIKLIDSFSSKYKYIRKYSQKKRLYKYLGLGNKYHFIEKRYDYYWNINRINKILFNSTNLYFEGYFQDPKYFASLDGIKIINEILEEKYSKDDFLEKMDSKTNVSIHVRRGDYLDITSPFQIMTLEYYSKAIKLVEKKTNGSIRYFVFSDDMTWCKTHLTELNRELIFVDENRGKDSIKDLFLMSQCDHNIISASSFSWWGAYLNLNKHKTVVAPFFYYQNDYRQNENFGLKLSDWYYL
jgi:hypothetical protein